MYEQFFGLRERPFDLTPDPRYLVLTESHREALSSVEYGVASAKGITLLVGEAGSGKTTVVRTALERQSARAHCVYLHNPTLSRREFSEMLAIRYGLSARARESKAQMLVEFESLLKLRHDQGERSVLVVDEAQSLPLELLEEVRLLANIETSERKLLCVILAGQPELAARLNEHELRQLKQRIGLRCELRTLTRVETSCYVGCRIQVAGGDWPSVFTAEALEIIHDASRGIPRTISVIADNALLGGFGASVKPVTAQIVKEVCLDFDLLGFHDTADRRWPVASTPETTRSTLSPRAPRVSREASRNGTSQEVTSETIRESPASNNKEGGESLFANFGPKRKKLFPFLRG